MQNKEDKKALAKLGQRLKEAREKAGLTQTDVALKAGISANYYAVVERGEGNLSYDKLHKILRLLKIRSLDVD